VLPAGAQWASSTAGRQKEEAAMAETTATGTGGTGGTVELTEEEWREKLSPERYAVLRQKGTEPAWSGELLHVEGTGVFSCAGCGAALFPSATKFDSGSGWPSFYQALDDGVIREHVDRSFGMARTEITCARCGGHLGHVFPDGPRPTGQRYCVNSLSIEYEPDPD
jgi:peptide-methionine (R)-S-oxide reductase